MRLLRNGEPFENTSQIWRDYSCTASTGAKRNGSLSAACLHMSLSPHRPLNDDRLASVRLEHVLQNTAQKQ